MYLYRIKKVTKKKVKHDVPFRYIKFEIYTNMYYYYTVRIYIYKCISKLILFHDNIKTLNDVTCLVDDDVSGKTYYMYIGTMYVWIYIYIYYIIDDDTM